MPWFRGEVPTADVFIESQFTTGVGNVRPDEAEDRYTDEWAQEAVSTYMQAFVTPDRTKYVYRPRDRESLYDLDADPHEMRNLAGDPAHEGTIEDLRSRLLAAQERVGDPLSGPTVQ